MIYGFDTSEQPAATAALLVYAIYRSRDRKRYKATPDMWSQIERFTKAAAKRAETLPRFIESMKPRVACATIHPRWMEVGIKGFVAIPDQLGNTAYYQANDSREFLTAVLESSDANLVLDCLYKETSYVILLVRDRLEREKPIESKYDITTEEE